MKIQKLIISALFVLGVFFWNCGFASAQAEQIDDFDVTVKMNADSSIDVAEKITYDTGLLQKHGIYRNIPVRYEARGGNFNLRISDISVTDEKGVSYEFTTSDEGSEKVLKIGDPDVLLPAGKHIYIIHYKIKRAINYFDDHDELYWNATGNEWKVPIESAAAHVIFPEGIRSSDVQIKCYAGPAGSTKSCDGASYVFVNNAVAGGADFTEDSLSVGKGLTFVVGVPVGLIYKPTPVESFMEILKDNWIIFVPIIVFAIMFYLWWTRGRDPKGRETIVPEYDVPDNLTPAEAGTVVDENCGQKEIVAEIIYLAEGGYLKIKREEKQVLFIKSADYTLEKLKDGSDLENKFDRELFDGIFDKSKSVKFSELKGEFYSHYEAAIKDINESVYKKGYFSKNPRNIFIEYMARTFLLFFIVLFAIDFNIFGVYGVFSILLSAVIIVLFAKNMPQKTRQGVIAKEHILGLKDYLTVAEKDRLEFHNAPEKNPEQFEKLLPYAIALGVEKEWAKQFEGIYNANPSWYEDSRGFNNFSAIYFVNSIGDFRSNFASTAMTPPASSGGSGFGGGGFSGGGFGGGGGGSW